MSLRSMEMWAAGDLDHLESGVASLGSSLAPIREDGDGGAIKAPRQKKRANRRLPTTTPSAEPAASPASKPKEVEERPPQEIGTGESQHGRGGLFGLCCGRRAGASGGGGKMVDPTIAERLRSFEEPPPSGADMGETGLIELRLGQATPVNAATMEALLFTPLPRPRKVRFLNFDPWSSTGMTLVRLLWDVFASESVNIDQRHDKLVELVVRAETPAATVQQIFDDRTWAARKILNRKQLYKELRRLRLDALRDRARHAQVAPKDINAAADPNWNARCTIRRLECDLEVHFVPRAGTGKDCFWRTEAAHWESEAKDNKSWENWLRMQANSHRCMSLASPVELVRSVMGRYSERMCEAFFSTSDTHIELPNYAGLSMLRYVEENLQREEQVLQTRLDSAIADTGYFKIEEPRQNQNRQYTKLLEIKRQQVELARIRRKVGAKGQYSAEGKTAQDIVAVALRDEQQREEWRRTMAIAEEISMELQGAGMLQLAGRALAAGMRQADLEKVLPPQISRLAQMKRLLLAPPPEPPSFEKPRPGAAAVVGFGTLAWTWCDSFAFETGGGKSGQKGLKLTQSTVQAVEHVQVVEHDDLLKTARNDDGVPVAHPFKRHMLDHGSTLFSTTAREHNTDFQQAPFNRCGHPLNGLSKYYWQSATGAAITNDAEIRALYEQVIFIPLGQMSENDGHYGSADDQIRHYQSHVFNVVLWEELAGSASAGAQLQPLQSTSSATTVVNGPLNASVRKFTFKTEVERHFAQIEESEVKRNPDYHPSEKQTRILRHLAAERTLQVALRGRRILLFLDDCWNSNQYHALAHVDWSVGSRVLVTSRVYNFFDTIRASTKDRNVAVKDGGVTLAQIVEVASQYTGCAQGDRSITGKLLKKVVGESAKDHHSNSLERIGRENVKMKPCSLSNESKQQLKLARNTLCHFLMGRLLEQQQSWWHYEGWYDEEQLQRKLSAGATFGDKECADLAQIMPQLGERGKAPVTINLRENQITNAGAKVLAAVLPETSVVKLDLSQNPIELEGWKALWAAEKLCNAQRAALRSSGDLASLPKLEVAGFAPEKQGTTISWEHKKVGDPALAQFAKTVDFAVGGKDAEIKEINMSDCRFTDRSTVIIARRMIQPAPNLRIVNLSYNRLNDLGTIEIARSLFGSSVEELTLSHNLIGDHGVFALRLALLGEVAFARDAPGGVHWRNALRDHQASGERVMEVDDNPARMVAVKVAEALQLDDSSELTPTEVSIAAREKLGMRWLVTNRRTGVYKAVLAMEEGENREEPPTQTMLHRSLTEVEDWMGLMSAGKSRLKSLTLNQNQLTDASADAFGSALPFCELSWLNVRMNLIGEDGWKQLNEAKLECRHAFQLG